MSKEETEVKKKIKNLRGAYVSEKKKVVGSKKSGSSTEDVYKSHLFYFDELNFLENVVVLRKTTNNLPENISSGVIEFSPSTQDASNQEGSTTTEHIFNYDDSQESVSNTSYLYETPPSHSKVNPAKKARVERDKKFNAALDSIMNNAEEDTIFSSFGKSVQLQLSKMPIAMATKAMAELQQVLATYMEQINQHDTIQTELKDANIIF